MDPPALEDRTSADGSEAIGAGFCGPFGYVAPKHGGTMKRLLAVVVVCVLAASLASAAIDVPLKHVTLFTSGVGYFERLAEVTNSDTAELSFNVDQINDVIKSLVLIDESGGAISAVTYDSRDPLARTLKSLRVDIADNPDRATLLNRLRGVMVRVKTTGQDMEGKILGVERKPVVEDEVQTTLDILSLKTGEGIKSVSLDEVQNTQILDEDIRADLDEALDIVASGMDRDQKYLQLSFTGKGQRDIRVGYLVETPLWKTSYRLVIKESGAYLQGWAHVENTTDEDWNNVSLSLVSGRPLSFIQDLYQPFYLKRPVVEMETYGAVVPPSYESGAPEEKMAMMAAAPAPMRMLGKGREEGYGNGMLDRVESPAFENMGSGGVESQAASREAGELFEYAIKEPLSLPRQQSAMIPIVNSDVKGEALSIFNTAVNDRFPLNGVELENTTKLNLMRGPVTVFESGIYAGDARLADTRPGEKKLISYALDLACEVTAERESEPEEIVSLKIVRGSLFLQKKYIDATKYRILSKRDQKRWLLIEHPLRVGWELVEPKEALEKTPGLYRFRVTAEPKKAVDFLVRLQRVGQEAVLLSNLDERGIGIYVRQKAITAKVRDALKKLSDMQNEVSKIRVQIAALEGRRNEITEDQTRIRENMKTVAKTSESYSRWERKLASQEDELDQIRTQMESLKATEIQKQQGIDEYITALEVE
jgi:hypothetical protein